MIGACDQSRDQVERGVNKVLQTVFSSSGQKQANFRWKGKLCDKKNWTKAIESDLNQVKKAGTLL